MAFSAPRRGIIVENDEIRIPTFKATPIDNFADGAEIRRVANGYIVTPRRPDCGFGADITQSFVFGDAAEMATWIRKRYTVKAG